MDRLCRVRRTIGTVPAAGAVAVGTSMLNGRPSPQSWQQHGVEPHGYGTPTAHHGMMTPGCQPSRQPSSSLMRSILSNAPLMSRKIGAATSSLCERREWRDGVRPATERR